MAGLATLACVEADEGADRRRDPRGAARRELPPRGPQADRAGPGVPALMDTRGCSARQLAETLRIAHQAVGRALSLLTLPVELQRQVDAGIVPASAASEVAKVKDDDARREIAGKIAAGELTRDETVEAVRQVASKPRPGTSKGKGRGGARPRKVTEHVIRTAAGPRVTVEFKKGLDAPAILTAL